MKKFAAIYARVSSYKQKEGENIQSQVSSLVEYALKLGYTIPDGWKFMDDGFSGSTLQRPSLDALRENIREGIVDVVFVYSPDRLSRSYAYQLLLEMEFQKRETELIYMNTPKAKNPEEQMAAHFKGIFAEYERAQITERCRRGRVYRAKQGSVSVIPSAPLGYDYVKKSSDSIAQYVINKDAQTVKFIFELYTKKNISLSEICRELERKDIAPKKSKKWCRTTVRDILKNDAYTGTAYFGKTERSRGVKGRIFRTPKGERRCEAKSPLRIRPKELWVPINVPQIISESDFEIAQVKLEENKRFASRNTKKPSILQGLLICGYCEGTYYKKIRASKYPYYCCGRRVQTGNCFGPSIKQEELDNLVWNHVIDLLKNPQLIEEEIERRSKENQGSQEIEEKLKYIKKELLRLSKAKDKLLDAYQDGECLTLECLKERLKGIDLKEKALLKEKTSYEKFIFDAHMKKNIKTNISQFCKQLESTEKLSIVDKQNILRLLVNQIVITGTQIEIQHCIPCNDENFSPLCRDCFM